MNLSAPFIKRPVATTLMALAFLLVGTIAYNSLPVAALPNVDFPTLQINANLPGASPETMASNVATPLERQFSLISGISQMTSVSSLGSTSITVQFDLNQNLTDDFEQVQAAINAASAQLPTNLPAQPTIRRTNPADAPIMIIALSSPSLPLSVVDNYADVILSQQISRIDGVGLVNIGGEQKPAMRIRLDPRKIAARGLQIDTVRQAIVAATTNSPKGNIIGPNRAAAIYANDQILDVTPWQNLVVGYQKGAPIRIRDIGTAENSVENDQIGAFVYPGKSNTDPTLTAGKCIFLIVFKSPGANVIDTVDKINAALPQLQASVPPAVQIHILMDRTQTIRASVADVKITLLVTIILVVLVIYLFLRNVRATIIPSTVIPLALLSAMAVMLALNFSLDNLSLMALTIAVGFVVDDAIVMEEVIWQRLEQGESAFQAALAGAGEISFTVLSISISLVAVFTPLMFMGGVVGLLMREFAITLSAAVLLSLVLTLTLTPMLCSRFLRHPEPPTNSFTKALERGFAWVETSYARTLDVILRHKFVTLMVFMATICLAVILYATSHTGFFPQQDNGFLQGNMLVSQDSSYLKTLRKMQEVAAVVQEDPDVSGFGMFLGNSSPNQANLSIALKPQASGRTRTADEIVNDLRPKLAQVVGVRTLLQARQDINIGGRFGQAQYQYTLSDSDLDELNTWAPKMLAAMEALP
ncbi:MAG TPA: efflux RND transporter permease subunit, partial [Rhizomicrobium sp.]|nr:efflux RND transporter permease subunit [Rhizomicrobium sp.]